MIELLITSFPVIIWYFVLKRRGEKMTVSNMKTAVFSWLALAFMLFVIIFFYHPKSYSGLVPFRTISVVAQANGPVTKVLVKNGQRVQKGDLLFQIENATQKAALTQASTALKTVDASETKARNATQVAKANVTKASAALAKVRAQLRDAEELVRKNVGRANKAERLRFTSQESEAALAATQAQLNAAQTELTEVIPAARKSSEAAYNSAKVALAKTQVRAFSPGMVTQLSLTVGSPASQLIFSPAMVIVPDRDKDVPVRIVAGFSQVAKSTLHVGMSAEIACDSNSNLSMKNTIMSAKVVGIQPAIAAGQITPGATLIELNSRVKRGTLLVFFEVIHKQHEAMLLDGSGCIVQTYSSFPGVIGHMIGATGIIKAFLLRIKAWGVLIIGVGIGGGNH